MHWKGSAATPHLRTATTRRDAHVTKDKKSFGGEDAGHNHAAATLGGPRRG